MSQTYPKLKEQLWSWALLSTTPADVITQVCGVDDTYVYSAAHDTIADLGSSIVIDPTEFQWSTVTDGVLKGFAASLTGITPGPTLDALVVLLSWAGGTQLVCYIDESSDASLPQELSSSAFSVLWDSDGICKI